MLARTKNRPMAAGVAPPWVLPLSCAILTLLSIQIQPTTGQQDFSEPTNYPYYMQSPLQPGLANQTIAQRSNIPPTQGEQLQQSIGVQPVQSIQSIQPLQPPPPPPPSVQEQPIINQNQQLNVVESGVVPPTPPSLKTNQCLYDKRYFGRLDECLTRKPYPIIGLPAFKNEDLLIKRGLSDRHGCVFTLSNGLFKNYQLSKYSVDSDSQCLDGGKVQLSMQFSNISLYYLWTLRCLNYADQLLDDATFNGKTTVPASYHNDDGAAASAATSGIGGHHSLERDICIGSSQNFGFTSLQLTTIEAQVELATDIYKNWRLTNVTVAMLNNNKLTQDSSISSDSAATNNIHLLNTGIKDFVFESLDSDELNWRYMHLYQNWSRNRLHVNFLEQFKRFLWISLQRCLSESSEKLPVKLVDLFSQHKYN